MSDDLNKDLDFQDCKRVRVNITTMILYKFLTVDDECPLCSSKELEGDDLIPVLDNADNDTGFSLNDVTCHGCNARWYEMIDTRGSKYEPKGIFDLSIPVENSGRFIKED